MGRTASHDGSFDNIIDGVSCFSIVFPYTVEVNQTLLMIRNEDDFREVERILDQNEYDEDHVAVLLPITLRKSDFSEEVVNTINDFRNFDVSCVEGGNDPDIECVDFEYPFTVFSFQVATQQTNTESIGSDKDLKLFLNGLNPEDLISIDFPINLILIDGSKTTINTIAELVETLDSAVGACDEDDDDDYSDDDFTEEGLADRLLSCTWEISRFIRNGNNASIGTGWLFFMEDGTVIFENDPNPSELGTWEITRSDDGVMIQLTFEEYQELNFNWIAHDIGDGRIRFFGGNSDKILLKEICEP